MEEINRLRLFTVEEANQLIPQLESLILELRQKRELILAQEVEIDALELVADKNTEDVPPAIHQKVEDYQSNVNRFYSLVDTIYELGGFLKDLELGLVDFYTLYQGHVVYLCWKMGEKEITTWHEVGRGYSFRQPIEFERKDRESSG